MGAKLTVVWSLAVSRSREGNSTRDDTYLAVDIILVIWCFGHFVRWVTAMVLFDLFQSFIESAKLVIPTQLLDLLSPYSFIIFIELDLYVKYVLQQCKWLLTTLKHLHLQQDQKLTSLRDLS